MPGEKRKLKAARHDSDDDIRFAIEKNFAAEDLGVAMKARLPGGVAEDSNGDAVRVLLISENATKERLNAKRCEYTGGHAGVIDLGGLADTGELVTIRFVAADSSKALGVPRVVDDVGSGDAGFAVAVDFGAFDGVGNDDEFIGIRERQGAQQHAFDDGEDSRGGANAEGEHENGRGRESWAFEQMTDSDLQVTQHGKTPPGITKHAGVQIRSGGSGCSARERALGSDCNWTVVIGSGHNSRGLCLHLSKRPLGVPKIYFAGRPRSRGFRDLGVDKSPAAPLIPSVGRVGS